MTTPAPRILIDDLSLDIDKRLDGYYELEYEMEAHSAFIAYGPNMHEEYDSAETRAQVLRGLQVTLLEMLPIELRQLGFRHGVVEILGKALASFPYLMETVKFIPVEKVGIPFMFPISGRFLDVSLEIDDKMLIDVTPDGTVKFLTMERKNTLPNVIANLKTSEYGYLPASQGKSGVFLPKTNCPKPKASPKQSGSNVYCLVINKEGVMPPYVECGGFGGVADGMTICRYAKKMKAEKE